MFYSWEYVKRDFWGKHIRGVRFLPNTFPGLTDDGQNHNHKVKHIPADREVVVSQREHLQHTLAGEEHDEDQVDPVQDVIHVLCLVISFHHHSHHVQADQDHDDDVEGLLGDQVKDKALKLVLENEKKMSLLIQLNNFLSFYINNVQH